MEDDLELRSFSSHLLSAGFRLSLIYSTGDRTQDFMHAQPTKQHSQLLKILNGHWFCVYLWNDLPCLLILLMKTLSCKEVLRVHSGSMI